MKQKNLDSVFQKINDSYQSLIELNGKTNVEVEIKRVRDELVISICKIYFNPQIKYDDISYKTETYSFEIIEKINECLSKYENSSSKQKGVLFSRYVCNSIHKMLASLKEEDAFKKKSGGQEISRDALSLMNKVKDQDRVFEGFGILDESKRNKKIALTLGISEQKVLEMKRLLTLNAIPDEQTSEDG
ncbi:MAG: hypothetical protein HUK25_09850, partial [Treponema sp.]|nr:hypothetical protein [Treponema sp.]